MSKAIRFHAVGGPDVLVYEDVQVGDPGPGQARVRNTAIGLNFIDTYHRSGLYPLPLPSGVGLEAAAVVVLPRRHGEHREEDLSFEGFRIFLLALVRDQRLSFVH